MTTFAFRSTTFAVSLAALAVASTSAVAQPTYKHKAHQVHQFLYMPIPSTATALVPAAFVHTQETDGLSRNSEDCNRGCIDH